LLWSQLTYFCLDINQQCIFVCHTLIALTLHAK
jgi:hypothetical protein